MPTSAFGGQFHSISTSGMMLFQQGAFNSGMGGVVLDLASAPIEPGEYNLEINAAMGGVEIYLPRYVQFTIDGTSVFGGTNIHEGLGWWKSMTARVKDTFSISNQVPEFAVAPIDPERPVKIRFLINSGMGGVNIYRL